MGESQPLFFVLFNNNFTEKLLTSAGFELVSSESKGSILTTWPTPCPQLKITDCRISASSDMFIFSENNPNPDKRRHRHQILDGHFFTFICCKNCNVCMKKTMGWPIFLKKNLFLSFAGWSWSRRDSRAERLQRRVLWAFRSGNLQRIQSYFQRGSRTCHLRPILWRPNYITT